MSIPGNEQLYELCRICLKKSYNMKSLLNNYSQDTINILDMFTSLTNSKLELKESIPYQLCSECESKLFSSFNFQKQCFQSNEYIKKICSTFTNNHKNCFTENEQVPDNIKDGENSLPDEIEDEDFEVKQENECDPLDIDDHDHNVEIEENYDEMTSETENVVSKSIKWSQCKNFSVSEVVEAIKEVQKSQNTHTRCIFCPYESNTTKNLSVHITLAHSHVKNWCSFCNEVIDEDYEMHTQQHLKDAGKCKFCLKVVKRYYLVQHLKLHAGVKMFTCKTCHKSFQTIRCLKYHLRRHRNSITSKEIGEKAASSNFENANDARCSSESKEKEEESNNEGLMGVDLNFELKSNEDIAELMTLHNYCKECNQTFRNMSKHMKESHSKPDEPKEREEFTCDLCSKKFLRKKGLRAHLMIHQNQGNYRCSYCSKLCLNKLQLIEHERVHTGERPNICSVCGKGFKQLASLNLHMRIHSERPIKCTLCEKRFCRQAELRLHMLNHSGEKPFLCSECGKGFTQKSHLRAHSQSHSDETPFQCSECSKAFKNSYALKLHSRTHSGYKALKCPYCPYGCNRSYSLKQHIMKRHSVV